MSQVSVKSALKSNRILSLSPEDIYIKINKNLSSNNNSTFYEIIKRDCKAYIDIDKKVKGKNELKEQRINMINEIKNKLSGEQYYLFDSCGFVNKKWKLSFHIIFKDYNFESGKDVEKFVKQFDLPIDISVYKKKGKTQLFRIPYTSKEKDNRVLKKVDINSPKFPLIEFDEISPEEYTKYFITMTSDLPKYVDISDESNDSCTEEEEFEVVEPLKDAQEDKKYENRVSYEKIVELIECINYEKQNWEWGFWCKFIWCIKNIADIYNEDMRELIHKLSDQNDKYDKNYTNELYDNPKNKSGKKLGIGSMRKWIKEKYPEQYFKWMESLVPKKYFDADDKYYWLDFIEELTSKRWMVSDGLNLFWKTNINRVFIATANGSMYIKIDNNNPFENLQELPRHIIRYQIKDKNENVLDKQESFRHYYHNGGSLDVKNYNKLVFKPANPEEECIERDRNFNMWTGFKAKLLPKNEIDLTKIELILNHIKEVWADNNENIHHYLLSWFHKIFKYPRKKTKVALVLRSEKQQIGKGMIIEDFLIPYVFGKNISTKEKGLNFVIDKFNNDLMNKILICADELSTVSGSYHAAFDCMKDRITGGSLKIEIKFGSKFQIDDYANFIMLTNHDFTIKVEKYDARYFIQECNDKYRFNFDYFDKFGGTYNEETGNHFFSYCYYLENPVDVRNIPQTKLKTEMQINSSSTPIRFLEDAKEVYGYDDDDDCHCGWTRRIMYNKDKWISAGILYDIYINWCDENHEKITSKRMFGKHIKGKIEKKKSNGYKYLISF